MNIVELRDKLTEIIEENEKRGWAYRNKSELITRTRSILITDAGSVLDDSFGLDESVSTSTLYRVTKVRVTKGGE